MPAVAPVTPPLLVTSPLADEGQAVSAEWQQQAVARCERCRATGQREGGLTPAAAVQVDVTGGWAGFPMKVCRLHYAAARAFFGDGLVVVVERYAR